MYLVAHQDDCQMVVGTPKAGTIQNIRNPENGEMIGYIVGIQQPRQCTCEPLTVQLEYRNSENEIPHYPMPRIIYP